MEFIVNNLLVFLEKELGLDSKSKEKIRYGLDVLVGEMVKLIVIFLVSLYLNKVQEFFIILASFFIIRIRIGGTHAKTYMGCLLRSIFNFCLIYFIADKITISTSVAILFTVISCILITKIELKDKYDRIIDTQKKQKGNFELILIIVFEFIIIQSVCPENNTLFVITIIYIFLDYFKLKCKKGEISDVKS
ncbi:MAG: accessory gene regulator B family protein [Sarcina sp.]